MIVVIYAEDMEPVTVLDLPMSRPEFEAICSKRRDVFLHTQFDLRGNFLAADSETAPIEVRSARVYWEAFVRNGNRHWMFFTQDEVLVMGLRAAFLPGQRPTVQTIRHSAFARGFMDALVRAR